MNPEPVRFTELAQFQPKQIEAWYTLLQPETKYLLYGGAAFGGKSYFLRWAMIGLGMYYYSKYGFKNVQMGLFSEDYPTLKDRQVVRMKNEIPPWLGKLVDSRDEGYAFIGAPDYGSFIIYLRNLDDPSKYASTEFAAIGVEELTKNPESTFDDLRFRMRFPGINEMKFLGATNPGSVGHGWVKRKWVKPDLDHPDIEQERFKFVPAFYNDNKFVTKDYELQLDALPTAKRKAFKDGDWEVFAGQYFEEWREQLHVVKPFIPNPGSLVVGGMDWGRSARPSHKTAFYCGFDVVEKVFYNDISFYRCRTFLEVTGKDKTPEEWVVEIKNGLSSFGLSLKEVEWIHADTAMFHPKEDGSESISDQFGKADAEYIAKLLPSNKDRIGGWESMHKWLRIAPDGRAYWEIAENCKHLIRTLPELVHDDNKPEDVDTEGEDHPGDGERYKKMHLKWIDGGASGAIMSNQLQTQPKAPIIIIDGKQQGLDLKPFENAGGEGGTTRVIGG